MDSQVIWLAGVSITGFLFLMGWLMTIQAKVSVVEDMKKKVDEVHFCLVGNMGYCLGVARYARDFIPGCRRK